MLDHFQVEACYLQEQAVLAMYSYSAISGIVGKNLPLQKRAGAWNRIKNIVENSKERVCHNCLSHERDYQNY